MSSALSGAAPSLAGGSTAVVRGLTVTGAAGFGAPLSISHGFQGGAVLTGTGSVSMTGMDLPAEVDITNSTPANGSAMVVNGLRVRYPNAGNAPGAQVRGLRLETGDGGNYNRADIGFVSAGNTGPANTYNFLQFTIPPCTTGGLFLRAPPGDPALARVGVNKSAPNYELDVTGGGHFSGNVAIDGALTIAGSTTVINSNVTVMSEQLSITNAGTGPALLVTQTGAQQLARFVDDAVGNVFVIHSGGGVSIGSGTVPAAGTALGITGGLTCNGPVSSYSGNVGVANGAGSTTVLTNAQLTGTFIVTFNFPYQGSWSFPIYGCWIVTCTGPTQTPVVVSIGAVAGSASCQAVESAPNCTVSVAWSQVQYGTTTGPFWTVLKLI